MKKSLLKEVRQELVVNQEYQHQYGNGRRYTYLGRLNDSHGIFFDGYTQRRVNLAYSMIINNDSVELICSMEEPKYSHGRGQCMDVTTVTYRSKD